MNRALLADLSAYLGLFFVWWIAGSLFELLDLAPGVATVQVLLVVLLFTTHYLLPGGDPARVARRERSGVRRLGAQWPWAIVAAAAVAVLLVVGLELYAQILPQPPSVDPAAAAYLARALGWLPSLAVLLLAQPLFEEVIFRGWIQRRLALEFGPEVAIINAAALFAVAHLDLWWVPAFFLLGLACGYAVYVSGSVWSGVLLHFAFNAAIALTDQFGPAVDRFLALESGARGIAISVGLMLLSGAVAAIAWRRQRALSALASDAPTANGRANEGDDRAPPD